MRRFFYQVGRTINSGKIIDRVMRQEVTAYSAKNMRDITGPDIGTYYPGPEPFHISDVKVSSPTQELIRGCQVETGWAENRATHKPLKPLKLVGTTVYMVKVRGRWLFDGNPIDKHVSCRGVVVTTQKW